jgi:hypothetical protein
MICTPDFAIVYSRSCNPDSVDKFWGIWTYETPYSNDDTGWDEEIAQNGKHFPDVSSDLRSQVCRTPDTQFLSSSATVQGVPELWLKSPYIPHSSITSGVKIPEPPGIETGILTCHLPVVNLALYSSFRRNARIFFDYMKYWRTPIVAIFDGRDVRLTGVVRVRRLRNW